MKNRRIRTRMCLRKRKLETVEAHILARRYRQRFYRCPYCGWLHLTKRA